MKIKVMNNMNTMKEMVLRLPEVLQSIWISGRHWEVMESEEYVGHIPYYNKCLEFLGSGYFPIEDNV